MNRTTQIFTSILLLMAIAIQANVNLPAIYGDHMVLQRNSETKLWGWANPFEEVKVVASWSPTDTLEVTADRHANWEVPLKTPAGPGPYTITISGYNTIVLNDVLVGEVWVASGQSNMEWTTSSGIIHEEDALKEANQPNIRLFTVGKNVAAHEQLDVKGNWQECTPETMPYFSAIAYFFGKKLNEELDVPIGLISSNWGGTPAETWIPDEAYQKDKMLGEAAILLKEEPWCPSEPSLAYNAMLAPIIPYKIAGVIWYQGETNTQNPQYYTHVFSSMIREWRKLWDNDFPFYFAQIAPYKYDDVYAGAKVRDAQRKTLALENTGMVMTADIGNVDDIHPRNKLDVGLRFAEMALVKHYQVKKELVDGPLVKSAVNQNGKIQISFNASEGLHFKNGSSSGLFEVAGEDKNFQTAKAVIKGNEIQIKTSIKEPKFVRYAWRSDAISDIYNSVDLPASSFLISVE